MIKNALTINYMILWEISNFIVKNYLKLAVYFPYIPMLFELIKY